MVLIHTIMAMAKATRGLWQMCENDRERKHWTRHLTSYGKSSRRCLQTSSLKYKRCAWQRAISTSCVRFWGTTRSTRALQQAAALSRMNGWAMLSVCGEWKELGSSISNRKFFALHNVDWIEMNAVFHELNTLIAANSCNRKRNFMLHRLKRVPCLVFIIPLANMEWIVINDGVFRNRDVCIEEKSSHGQCGTCLWTCRWRQSTNIFMFQSISSLMYWGHSCLFQTQLHIVIVNLFAFNW